MCFDSLGVTRSYTRQAKLKTVSHGTRLSSSRCEEPSLLRPLSVLPHADGSLDVLRLPRVWVTWRNGVMTASDTALHLHWEHTPALCVCFQTGRLAARCIMRSRACGAWSPPWSAALPGCSASSCWPSITPAGPAWSCCCSSTRWLAAPLFTALIDLMNSLLSLYLHSLCRSRVSAKTVEPVHEISFCLRSTDLLCFYTQHASSLSFWWRMFPLCRSRLPSWDWPQLSGRTWRTTRGNSDNPSPWDRIHTSELISAMSLFRALVLTRNPKFEASSEKMIQFVKSLFLLRTELICLGS